MSHSEKEIESSSSPPGKTLAKRITGTTSNVLAIALIIAAGIALGRQVLEWWRPPSLPPAAAVSQPVSADPDKPLLFEFGDWPLAMQRSTVTGDVNRAKEQLRLSCRALAQGADFSGPPRPAENRLLQRLAGEEPSDAWGTSAASFLLFELEKPLPMVVVVRQEGGKKETAAGNRRMVSWGVAFPASARVSMKKTDSGAWSLFACAVRPASDRRNVWQLPFPLPPECRRTLSLQTGEGGQLIGVAGETNLKQWQTWLNNQTGNDAIEWSLFPKGLQGRMISSDGSQIDIQLQQQSHGVRGMIVVSPPAEQAEQSE